MNHIRVTSCPFVVFPETRLNLEGVRLPWRQTSSNLTTLFLCALLKCMKNITLSAQEELIKRGREVAQQRNTTLNQLFRDWLQSLSGTDLATQTYEGLMADISSRVRIGDRKFTREEMNVR